MLIVFLLFYFMFFFFLFLFLFFCIFFFFFFFSSRRRHTRSLCDWSSDVCFRSEDVTIFRVVPAIGDEHGRIVRPPLELHPQPPMRIVDGQQQESGVGGPVIVGVASNDAATERSEERRGGKEWRSRWTTER